MLQSFHCLVPDLLSRPQIRQQSEAKRQRKLFFFPLRFFSVSRRLFLPLPFFFLWSSVMHAMLAGRDDVDRTLATFPM